MPKETTIRRIGNSSGLTISEALARQYPSEGDRVHIIETKEGLLITPYDPDFEEAMEIYAEGAKEEAKVYRNALRELVQ